MRERDPTWELQRSLVTFEGLLGSECLVTDDGDDDDDDVALYLSNYVSDVWMPYQGW